MLQTYNHYYKQVPNILSDETKKRLLEIAHEPGAFVDISYKISFFKLPSKIQYFNKTGLKCVCQMLRVTENGSKIHKDKNRYNEYENIFMPRQAVINFPLTPNADETYFYDDNEQFVCSVGYLEGNGAILNTGEKLHNVNYTGNGTPRIVFQLCFEETFDQVCRLYETHLRDIVL
jgi:hypothetical protein